MPSLEEHPLRRAIIGEMYLRRWPPTDIPSVIVQILRTVSHEQREAEQSLLARLDASPFRAFEIVNDFFITAETESGARLAWERHTEGSCITLFLPETDHTQLPGISQNLRWVPLLDWAMSFPGEVVRASKVLICPSDSQAAELLPTSGMRERDLVSCFVGPGIRIWSDFRIKTDGFGRILVAANGSTPEIVADNIQRLQELGNYRNLALLGLPLARKHWSELNVIEGQLADVGNRIVSGGITAESSLTEVSALSIALVTIASSTQYRMNATLAYGKLVEERLEELQVTPVNGAPNLRDFIRRRLSPALRTCQSFVDRQKQISVRSDKLASLLRIKVGTAIEEQNARILQSMERGSQIQVRLQQVVEGFSVIAISYYTISLCSYMLKPLPHLGINIDPAIAIGGLVPIAVYATKRVIHHRKRQALEE